MAVEYCVLVASTVAALIFYVLSKSLWFLVAALAAWAVFLLAKQYERQTAKSMADAQDAEDQSLVAQPRSTPQNPVMPQPRAPQNPTRARKTVRPPKVRQSISAPVEQALDPVIASMQRIEDQFQTARQPPRDELTIDGKPLPEWKRSKGSLPMPAKGLLPTMDKEPFLDSGAEQPSCVNMDRFIAYDKRFFEEPYSEEEERNLPDPFPDFFQEPNADSLPGPYSVVVTDSDRIYNPDLNAMSRDWITTHVQQQAQMERDAIRGRYSLMREIMRRNTGRKDRYGQTTGLPVAPIPVATPPIATSEFLYV